MPAATEYCQRKDVHFHMVLVHHLDSDACRFNYLSVSLNTFKCKAIEIDSKHFRCFRALIIFVPRVRSEILNARNRMVPKDVAFAISLQLDIGDWWLLYMLGRNLDPIIYKDVLTQLVEEIPDDDKKGRN